jgi:hypothetical protein
VTVVVRRPGPALDGLVRAITYQAGEQPRTSVEKILPGPGAGVWINLNRDEFRSFGSFRDTGQVVRVPGAMLAGPTSRAAVIEFEQAAASGPGPRRMFPGRLGGRGCPARVR